jgi:hypothetical protein
LFVTSSTGNGQWLEESSRHCLIFVHTDRARAPPPARSFPARPPLPRPCWPPSPVLHRALPSPTPQNTPQGTGSDWKKFPGTAHTDRQTDRQTL